MMLFESQKIYLHEYLTSRKILFLYYHLIYDVDAEFSQVTMLLINLICLKKHKTYFRTVRNHPVDHRFIFY